jgi:hypothetical protein
MLYSLTNLPAESISPESFTGSGSDFNDPLIITPALRDHPIPFIQLRAD